MLPALVVAADVPGGSPPSVIFLFVVGLLSLACVAGTVAAVLIAGVALPGLADSVKERDERFRKYGRRAAGQVYRVDEDAESGLLVRFEYRGPEEPGLFSGAVWVNVAPGGAPPKAGEEVEVIYLPGSDEAVLSRCFRPGEFMTRWS